MEVSIIASSGTLKGVYIQGVLSFFEEIDFLATSYFSASSSVISTLFATTSKSGMLGLPYWKDAAEKSREGMDMSSLVKASISDYSYLFKELNKTKDSPTFNIAVTKIINPEVIEPVRSAQAKKLGRRLLIDLARGNSEWVDENTRAINYCTKPDKIADPSAQKLSISNFEEVAYASTRMLHAWPEPAFIEGEDFIDASYTASCPIMLAQNMDANLKIIIDVNEGTTYESLAKKVNVDKLAESNENILLIKPSINLETLGVGFTSASTAGCDDAYELGYSDAGKFVAENVRLFAEFPINL